MNKRTPDGNATITHGPMKVVAADAIALLSGVNFGSVEKVIAAIEAIADYSGTDAQVLITLADVPTQRVVVSDPAYTKRCDSTRLFCRGVAEAEVEDNTDASDVLNLRVRFPV